MDYSSGGFSYFLIDLRVMHLRSKFSNHFFCFVWGVAFICALNQGWYRMYMLSLSRIKGGIIYHCNILYKLKLNAILFTYTASMYTGCGEIKIILSNNSAFSLILFLTLVLMPLFSS